MRERVFQRFVRLSDATIPGSGLGLSIVKSIADNHHATLTLAEGWMNEA
jgi:signal transduction histidine kinase